MNKTGTAIVGCGAIFDLHARAVNAMEEAELLLVVDTDPAKARRAAQTYGCEAAEDFRVILDREDIEVVHLCTPHHQHAPLARELLAAGKHVLTEKPIAHTVEAAEDLREAAARSSAQLGVVFQNRYNESSRRIREYIDSGRLGRLECLKGVVTWTRSKEYYTESPWRGRRETEGGGLLINQTIHTLDLLQWFAGEDVLRISGSVTTDALGDVIEVEDSAHACIDFAGGARALFYGTNAYLANSPVELELIFEKGTLLQRRDRLYLLQDGEETELCRPSQVATGAKSYWGVTHGLLIEDFHRHVREGRQFWLNAEAGIKALRLIHGIYESSKAGAAVSAAGAARG
ncbi:Gfo/Idh/MocA family oxidoreductase [Saccharibacillus sp. CPCC 101409]|uniref:Gfo/Idh/MocA family protein n=1 Tax=Saccharibacillus sp. CPCC 101409 TaxID=3058041 RepID=UPI0026734B3E|nr:Gfo/Idh/MocA family oxidoreductase [Saccharibacillus sp. CPCC 101409]MDO3410953.1 Gfo/Idh/MocA family oxidoreductase [Saccharibacillus sp. CPCC 101409]